MEWSKRWGTTKYRILSVGPLIAIAPKQASKQNVAGSSPAGSDLVGSTAVSELCQNPIRSNHGA